ncbi:flagellar biosynthesis repressor FlbT [Tianweitania sp. BSSL-BM11]|uniref:Flagellar biosynthesis repressor FlbT n=1 Tax=Tianweitania aestuarii TaxID=2814886 RepID=A0ABS5RX15_9HYPH|nr:flagellar biosynthesis repressor FlbT [Tianweitania aestuarii]MBS9721325.1 flagellar biosynthesis repressor FlbT [Tianweitania aestuarii]
MKSRLKIALKPGETIYVNGAVISVDRKVSLEFHNDVKFLLQNHVMQAEDATSPLRRLYLAVQTILMNAEAADQSRSQLGEIMPGLLDTFRDGDMPAKLGDIDRMVAAGQFYEALRSIRSLFPQEDALLGRALGDGNKRTPVAAA